MLTDARHDTTGHPAMIAIVGASGKLANATLRAVLEHGMIPASQIVCTTSQREDHATWKALADLGVRVRHATFDSAESLETALQGCSTMYLVSSPRIQLDFHDTPPGTGRERDHFVAIDAARRIVGLKHIYYTSLAFACPSKASVMQAHIRTEEYLASFSDVTSTIIREGLYAESWPLYFGHYDLKDDQRDEIVLAGDCAISWTAIKDLGLATAMIIAAPVATYAGRTMYLSNTKSPISLAEVADMVSSIQGRSITVKKVSREQYETHYIQEAGMDEGFVKWWSTTYDALSDGECTVRDSTLESLLSTRDVIPSELQLTINTMLPRKE